MNDDELLAQLRAADPASLSDAPTPDIDRLLEAAMTVETDTRPTPGTPGGSRRRWLPAVAAGVLLAAGGVVWGVAGHDTQPVTSPPVATTSETPKATPGGIAAATLQLTVGGAAGKCRPVEVADLRRMETAFEGTATAIKGELVTLRVDHWYRGGNATTVEVRSDVDAVATLLGVDFKVGTSYLITATEAQVSICGESGPSTPELRKLYEQAYAR